LKADCLTTYSLEIYSVPKFIWEAYDNAKHGYFISNWDAATAVATISNAGLNGAVSLKPVTTYQLRISKTSTYSLTPLKIAQDEFKLTLEESCFYNRLKMFDGTLGSSSFAPPLGTTNIPN
jgi:hypothetical protein